MLDIVGSIVVLIIGAILLIIARNLVIDDWVNKILYIVGAIMVVIGIILLIVNLIYMVV